MNRQELQAALKSYRTQGLVLDSVKLNGTTASLQAEYDRIHELKTAVNEVALEDISIEEIEAQEATYDAIVAPDCEFEGQPLYDVAAVDADMEEITSNDEPYDSFEDKEETPHIYGCSQPSKFTHSIQECHSETTEDFYNIHESIAGDLLDKLTAPMNFVQDTPDTSMVSHGQPLIVLLTACCILYGACYTLVAPLVSKYEPSTRRVARKASRFLKELYKSGVKLIEAI
jgi:hypothetical protein